MVYALSCLSDVTEALSFVQATLVPGYLSAGGHAFKRHQHLGATFGKAGHKVWMTIRPACMNLDGLAPQGAVLHIKLVKDRLCPTPPRGGAYHRTVRTAGLDPFTRSHKPVSGAKDEPRLAGHLDIGSPNAEQG